MTIANTTPAMRTIQIIGNKLQIVFALAFVEFHRFICARYDRLYAAVLAAVGTDGVPAVNIDRFILYHIRTPMTIAINVEMITPIIIAAPLKSACVSLKKAFIP